MINFTKIWQVKHFWRQGWDSSEWQLCEACVLVWQWMGLQVITRYCFFNSLFIYIYGYTITDLGKLESIQSDLTVILLGFVTVHVLLTWSTTLPQFNEQISIPCLHHFGGLDFNNWILRMIFFLFSFLLWSCITEPNHEQVFFMHFNNIDPLFPLNILYLESM